MLTPKIDTKKYLDYARNVRDVRTLGLLVFAGIVLLVTWSGIGVIQTNYELQKKIAALRQQVDLQMLENSNLRLRNQYYNTDQYLELQARRQFGKAEPGEKLLIVPRQVALAYSVEVEQSTAEPAEEQTPAKPAYQRNFEAWMDFLFRRAPLKD